MAGKVMSIGLAMVTTASLVLAGTGPLQDDTKKSDGNGKASQKEKTQGVEVEGISFEVPQSWKSAPATSAMRKATFRVAPAEGDRESAELVLFVFGGGAGGVEANVDRWRRQFADEDGDPPPAQSKKVKGINADVTRVEVAGTYTDPFAGTGPQENYRLLGAIVTTDQAGYFFKMIGPEKTMKKAQAGFDNMLSTIQVK